MAPSRRIVRAVFLAGMTAAVGMVLARILGYRLGPHTVVRCRAGHLYTTIWVPGIKLKGLDLGVARFQFCPIGRHWSLVVPVKEAGLSAEERAAARAHHDLWIP